MCPELSASHIANKRQEFYDIYSQICYEGTYIPNGRLREMVSTSVDRDEAMLLRFNLLQSVCVFPDSFRDVNGGSETMVVSLMLQSMLSILTNGFDGIHFLTQSRTPKNYMSNACMSEPKITFFRQPGVGVVTLATEAKGFGDSCRCCYSQLITCGGDAAIELCNQGVSIENVAIPVIAFTGLAIQFGAVYLMANSFPVLVMLSECLNPNGPIAMQLEISSWFIKFRAFYLQTCKLAADARPLPQQFEAVSLDCVHHFFKPVRQNFKEETQNFSNIKCSSYSFKLNQIMRMYELVSRVGNSNQLVLFPVGVIALPGSDVASTVALRNYLLTRLAKFYLSVDKSDHIPFIVFPYLSDEWTDKKPESAEHKAAYLNQVALTFDLLAQAGVAHLDARPANILWRILGGGCGVQVRLIDFEDVYQFGEVIPASFVKVVVKSYDTRYPIVAADQFRIVRACDKHNQFFREAIAQWVESDVAAFSEFTKSNHDAIYAKCFTISENEADSHV